MLESSQSAIKRVISKFGVYTSHIATLSEDSSVKCANSAKLKGYYQEWTDAKCSTCQKKLPINGPFNGRPFERARVMGRQCRRPAPLLHLFRTWSAKTSLDYHLEARIPVP